MKIQSFLPLTEPTFYILLSLVEGGKHGYGILKDVEALSGERVRLSTSTLYSAISRLREQGLIRRLQDERDGDGGPGLPRKRYALTALGRRILEAETARMQELVTSARLRLGQERI